MRGVGVGWNLVVFVVRNILVVVDDICGGGAGIAVVDFAHEIVGVVDVAAADEDFVQRTSRHAGPGSIQRDSSSDAEQYCKHHVY